MLRQDREFDLSRNHSWCLPFADQCASRGQPVRRRFGLGRMLFTHIDVSPVNLLADEQRPQRAAWLIGADRQCARADDTTVNLPGYEPMAALPLTNVSKCGVRVSPACIGTTGNRLHDSVCCPIKG